MPSTIPHTLTQAIEKAHDSWRPALQAGLEAMAKADSLYLPALLQNDYLPSQSRIFAAFAQPLDAVRYVLVGEGPYPRAESATGVCFMDGAVQELWSAKGLSKRVNRATSLRNFMKMLLVADGQLSPEQTTGEALAAVSLMAQSDDAQMIQSLPELQAAMHRNGFLLLNATLVYREQVPPAKESRAWEPFLRTVLHALLQRESRQSQGLPVLVLWGKIAEKLSLIPEAKGFPHLKAEHPYNLSFITNPAMLELFAPMRLLNKAM